MIKVLNQEVVELTELLANCKPGETVTFDQMSKKIGKDILECRWNIGSARHRALNQHNIVFMAVKGVGYKRLENDDIPNFAMRRVRRARTEAKRGVKELASVDYGALAPEKKIEHNLQMSLLGTISYSTQSSQIKKLRGAVQSSGLCLPIPNAMDAMK